MILRTRIHSGSYLSLEDMGMFSSKNSLEREMVYKQGFAFMIYLAYEFAEEVLREISAALGKKGVFTIEEAIELATRIPGKEVFNNWIAERKNFYQTAVAGMQPTVADTIEYAGFFNFFPKRSPDGAKLAYL